MSLGAKHEEKHISSMIYLPEMHSLNLNMKTLQTSPNGGTFLQNSWPAPFKNISIMENKDRSRNCFRLEET